jgi:hypothetical protein
MIKFENGEIVGWEAAIRGMRNPMNSWEKSDSHYECHEYDKLSDDDRKIYLIDDYIPGPNDLDLMTRLRNAGTDHRKFMRMITVYLDITAPLYWWKEFDTYKVGTVANSCSTMHKIHAKEFTLEDFSQEHLLDGRGLKVSHEDNCTPDESDFGFRLSGKELLKTTVNTLNYYRRIFLETNNKKYWWQMIQLLPSSYNQRRTIMLNYEVLANIYKSRRNHKLDEWRAFCEWIENLPHSELITGKIEEN